MALDLKKKVKDENMVDAEYEKKGAILLDNRPNIDENDYRQEKMELLRLRESVFEL